MRVLYIRGSGIDGGEKVAFLNLISCMRRRGVTPIVMTEVYNEINDLLTKEGVSNYALGYKSAMAPLPRGFLGPLKYVKRLTRFYLCDYRALYKIPHDLDIEDVDIIHTNSARHDFGCLLSKHFKIPHIIHLREFGDKDFGCYPYRRNYVSFLNRYTTKFISVSDAVGRHWASKGLNSNIINTIYDGVNNEDIISSSDSCKLQDILHMVIVGGVIRSKGQHIAVEAISCLPIEIRDKVRLDIVGWYDEKYLNEIKEFARNNKIANQIVFLGKRNDIHQILKNYQVGLMCSKSEGFGLVTAEYMHAQLGVIASSSGASVEIVENGMNGLLYSEGNAEELANCITKYYNDRDMLIKHSHEAKKKAVRLYTINKNSDSIFSLYKDLLGYG